MQKPPAQSTEQSVTLRIILVSPLAGVDYGVQQGKGTAHKVLQRQRSTDQDLVFDVQLPFKLNEDGSPNFTGQLAQGPPAARFIYLNIGKSAGQIGSPWERRLKVPLSGISGAVLKKALSKENVLQARLPGKAKDGGPSCATVQPIDGWQVSG